MSLPKETNNYLRGYQQQQQSYDTSYTNIKQLCFQKAHTKQIIQAQVLIPAMHASTYSQPPQNVYEVLFMCTNINVITQLSITFLKCHMAPYTEHQH